MIGSLVADLMIGPEVWLFLSLMGCLTLFFKFSRVWSVRNLDLLLLFALAPGFMMLVGARHREPWIAFVLLFVGSGLWLIRCLVDLGLSRRPLLEPNLNMAGLTCLSVGILGLLLAETISLPPLEGKARNPAETEARDHTPPPGSTDENAPVNRVLKLMAPGPLRPNPPQFILARILAIVAHLGIVAGLLAVGWWHFDRPITGMAMATCYVISPYTRIALVDSGQLLPSALIVTAVAFHQRPAVAGVCIGLAAGWMPACLGLVALWTGFYHGRGAWRFLSVSMTLAIACGALAARFHGLAAWCRALGARNLSQIGMWPGVVAPETGSFWSGIDVNWRLPVLILYLALVIVTSIWPMGKNLGELIALTAGLLVASQFWFLLEGGTLVLLYLPMILLMMFRPTLITKRALLPAHGARAAAALSSVR
ncbi:MAG: hypothetical protein AB7I30_03930 [Isosphaeraceae bacterium]